MLFFLDDDDDDDDFPFIDDGGGDVDVIGDVRCDARVGVHILYVVLSLDQDQVK